MHCAISKGAGKELTIDGDVAIPRMYSIMVNVLVFVKLTADVFILGTEVAHVMQVSGSKLLRIWSKFPKMPNGSVLICWDVLEQSRLDISRGAWQIRTVCLYTCLCTCLYTWCDTSEVALVRFG